MMHHILSFPKEKRAVVDTPLPLRLLLDGLVAMLKAAMRARMTRGSKNRTEVINEGRCNGIDWSREIKGDSVEEMPESDHDVHQRSRRFEIPTRSGFTIPPNF